MKVRRQIDMRRRGVTPLLLSYAGFVSLGLPDGLLGAAWPSMRATFHLPVDALGVLLVMYTVGYLAASFYNGRILGRFGIGALLTVSCLATGASMLGYAAAPRWRLMIAFACLAGLSAGSIDAGLNTHAARNFSARSVNWLHASYGLGATLGPLFVTSVLMSLHTWRFAYAIVGAGQLTLAICFGITSGLWNHQAPEHTDDSAQIKALVTLRMPAVLVSVAIFFLYTGLEAAVGVWSYSLLTESRAVSMQTAGACVSIYWGCLTAGRILSGFTSRIASPQQTLTMSVAFASLGAALLCVPSPPMLGFFGLAVLGLSFAPVFPTLISAAPARLQEHAPNAIGFQISGAVLGQSLIPAAIGVIAHQSSLEVLAPIILAGIALLHLFCRAYAAHSLRPSVSK